MNFYSNNDVIAQMIISLITLNIKNNINFTAKKNCMFNVEIYFLNVYVDYIQWVTKKPVHQCF